MRAHASWILVLPVHSCIHPLLRPAQRPSRFAVSAVLSPHRIQATRMRTHPMSISCIVASCPERILNTHGSTKCTRTILYLPAPVPRFPNSCSNPITSRALGPSMDDFVFM
ncbi:hypothetical protein C8Q76DRAFT_736568 [Earliella scabrosa]|nr:hypothetical protein C8Q76DRAFT_736568 [Earliella scabrosa]